MFTSEQMKNKKLDREEKLLHISDLCLSRNRRYILVIPKNFEATPQNFKVELRESEVHGLGVFALQRFKYNKVSFENNPREKPVFSYYGVVVAPHFDHPKCMDLIANDSLDVMRRGVRAARFPFREVTVLGVGFPAFVNSDINTDWEPNLDFLPTGAMYFRNITVKKLRELLLRYESIHADQVVFTLKKIADTKTL